jgi:hypothetical protein
MKMSILSAAALLTLCSAGVEAFPKNVQSVTCQCDQVGAHTLVIGNCSFEGDIARQVTETCKNEDDLCTVQAHGWDNGQGMYMITGVESVQARSQINKPSDNGDGPIFGFRTPSNNIHCQTLETGKENVLRCDLADIDNAPPAKPKDCDLEWGGSFGLSLSATKGERLCVGDTVRDEKLPQLSYGDVWQRAGFTCNSQRGGITCFNADRHGFFLRRVHNRSSDLQHGSLGQRQKSEAGIIALIERGEIDLVAPPSNFWDSL